MLELLCVASVPRPAMPQQLQSQIISDDLQSIMFMTDIIKLIATATMDWRSRTTVYLVARKSMHSSCVAPSRALSPCSDASYPKEAPPRPSLLRGVAEVDGVGSTRDGDQVPGHGGECA